MGQTRYFAAKTGARITGNTKGRGILREKKGTTGKRYGIEHALRDVEGENLVLTGYTTQALRNKGSEE